MELRLGLPSSWAWVRNHYIVVVGGSGEKVASDQSLGRKWRNKDGGSHQGWAATGSISESEKRDADHPLLF